MARTLMPIRLAADEFSATAAIALPSSERFRNTSTTVIAAKDGERQQAADHQEVALGEVQRLRRRERDVIPLRDQRVDAAIDQPAGDGLGQAAQERLEDIHHLVRSYAIAL